MKKHFFLIVCVGLMGVTLCFAAAQHSYKPDDGYVPDAVTAVKIAEAVLLPLYGQEVVEKEKPFTAALKDGVWIVTGTLHCPEGQRCFGGVAVVEIAKDDGRILRVSHGK